MQNKSNGQGRFERVSGVEEILKGNAQKVAVCLCGGGVAGTVFQIGCLAALESRLRSNSIDLVVGTSSGAALATAVAAEIPVERLYRALLDPADDFFRLERKHLFEVDRAAFGRAARSSVMAVRKIIASVVANAPKIDIWSELERLADCLPSGLFALRRYEQFWTDFMIRRGIPERFAELPKRLLIAARDLDTGERAVFGAGELADVPIARAICASSAVPPFFSPVRIHGRDYMDGGWVDPAPLDLIDPFDCSLLVVINPLVVDVRPRGEASVPTGHGRKWNIRDKGLWAVYHQWRRIGARDDVAAAVDRFRQLNPRADVLSLEPSSAATQAFLHSPMNFAARRVIIEDGFATTLKAISEMSGPVDQRLIANG
jgi:NTE family protein